MYFESFFHAIKVSKMKCTSSAPSYGKSVQWTAFRTRSTPYLALSDFGYSFLPIYGS